MILVWKHPKYEEEIEHFQGIQHAKKNNKNAAFVPQARKVSLYTWRMVGSKTTTAHARHALTDQLWLGSLLFVPYISCCSCVVCTRLFWERSLPSARDINRRTAVTLNRWYWCHVQLFEAGSLWSLRIEHRQAYHHHCGYSVTLSTWNYGHISTDRTTIGVFLLPEKWVSSSEKFSLWTKVGLVLQPTDRSKTPATFALEGLNLEILYRIVVTSTSIGWCQVLLTLPPVRRSRPCLGRKHVKKQNTPTPVPHLLGQRIAIVSPSILLSFFVIRTKIL